MPTFIDGHTGQDLTVDNDGFLLLSSGGYRIVSAGVPITFTQLNGLAIEPLGEVRFFNFYQSQGQLIRMCDILTGAPLADGLFKLNGSMLIDSVSQSFAIQLLPAPAATHVYISIGTAGVANSTDHPATVIG